MRTVAGGDYGVEIRVTSKPPVLIPYVCPVCAGPNAVDLVTVSRAGGASCGPCGRWLKSTDIMRAIHSPREAATSARQVRAPRNERPAMVWPPTAESRAAIKRRAEDKRARSP